ncbi:MAG TPA: hypothetical protein VM223_08375 [Planctomycetota bacterium]|nr:hypothetical protein [Planctomycetota bacterium]
MRYITPEQCIRSRLDERPAPAWKTALLVFRDFPSSRVALDLFAPVAPVRYRMLYNMTSADFEPFVFEADVGGNSIVLVTRCVWGGPQTAILVEELAALGVRTIVGYGVAGSIAPELPQGSFVVAARALPTDGTSKSYAADTIQTADPELHRAASAAGEKIGCPLRAVTAATVDALYRETSDLVENLRGQGGQIIQMECSPLYAVSRACGIRSVWLGYVTDCLVEGKWHDWNRPLPDANENAIRICRELLLGL